MTVVPLAPIVMKNVSLIVETDDYAKHVSSVVFTVEQSEVTWTGLDGTTYTELGPEKWKATVAYAQDWDTVNSLSDYLFTNRGQKKTVKFQPQAGSGEAVFTATCTLASGQIGGAVAEFANASATFGCDGAPVKSTAA
jgi:hypothetical protein